MWKVSRDSVRRLFRNESGVLAFSAPGVPGKRSYTTLAFRNQYWNAFTADFHLSDID